MLDSLWKLVVESGFAAMFSGDGWKNLIMIAIACVLLYLGIKKQYEPLPAGQTPRHRAAAACWRTLARWAEYSIPWSPTRRSTRYTINPCGTNS